MILIINKSILTLTQKQERKKMRKSILICTIPLLFFLVACGDSNFATTTEKSAQRASSGKGGIGETRSVELMISKSNEQDRQRYEKLAFEIENNPSIEKTEYRGRLFNGYIESSRVCLDFNNNNLCNYYEPLGTSNINGEFVFKVPMTQRNKDLLSNGVPKRVLASRGRDVNTARKFMAFLKAPLSEQNSQDMQINPLDTLVLTHLDGVNNQSDFNSQLSLKTDKAKKLFANSNGEYKNNLILQKTVQLMAMALDPDGEKEILEKIKETYENIDLDSSSYKQALDNISDAKLKTAVKEAKNLITAIENTDLNNTSKRQSLMVLLDAKINEAKVFFRNSDEEFSTSPIDTNNLEDEAIKTRLKEIGLIESKITPQMIKTIKDNNIKLVDLDKLEKVENIPGLEKLAELLKKKQNANSGLFVLKSFINGDKTELKVFFSHKLSEESKQLLEDINEVKKIYTIKGLTYEMESSSYDELENVNIIRFANPAIVGKNPSIFINELTLSDENDIYARALAKPTAIEYPRSVPKTGQVLVYKQGDDGSYGYGSDMNYEKLPGSGVISGVANLQWQDEPYMDGTNDNITFTQASTYCKNLNLYGYSDWRLPNVKEAVTTTSLNPRDPDVFEHYPQTEVIHVINENAALDKTMGVRKNGRVANLIDMDNEFWGYEAGKYGVRCVRDINEGSLYPHKAKDNIIMSQKDLTSYDPTLRLMFQDEPYTQQEQDAMYERDENSEGISIGKFGDLQHALNYCKSLNDAKYAGFENWRLPNANELFYSLNQNGYGTYQHRMPTYGYYITSSVSYLDGTMVSWFTGNHYNRKFLYNRTRGYIRCVRSMDEDELKEQRPINAPNPPKIKRRFIVPASKEVNVTAPESIFSKYKGIRLTQVRDVNLTSIDYEITNMLHKDYAFPTYKIKSLKKNGKDIPLDEKGYFRIYLERALTSDSYGKRKFTNGDKFEIVINNRIYDVTLNLTIGIDTNGTDDNNSQTPQPEAKKAPILQALADPIKVSQASGTRMPDGNGAILYFGATEQAHNGIPEKPQYNIIKNPGDPHVRELTIVSGNEKGYFETHRSTSDFVSLRVKKDQIKNLQPGSYTLGLKASNGKDSNTINVVIQIDPMEPPILKQNLTLDLGSAQDDTSYAKKTKDGRLILFIFNLNSSVLSGVVNLVEDEKGFPYNEQYTYEGSSENYEVVLFKSYGSDKNYGIAVKDGKKKVDEQIDVNVKVEAENGKIYNLSTKVNITGGTGEIISANAPKFDKDIYTKEATNSLKQGDKIGKTQFDYAIDMSSYSDDTVFEVSPSGFFKIEPHEGGGEVYAVVDDPSKLTRSNFNGGADGDSKEFTIKATNSNGDTDTAKLIVKLTLVSTPQLQAPQNPIEIWQSSGYRVKDGTTNIFTINPKNNTEGEDFNILKNPGEPILSSFTILNPNEDGNDVFLLDLQMEAWILKVPSDKVAQLQAKTYTLKIKSSNELGDSNTIDLKVKVVATKAPILKENLSTSLGGRPFNQTRKHTDGREYYWELSAGMEPSNYYPERLNLIQDINGFKSDSISYELVNPSDTWEIVTTESYGSLYYGIVLKGSAPSPEVLKIKVTGTTPGGVTASSVMDLTITD